MTKPFKKPVKKYADGELVTTDKKLATKNKGMSTTSSRSEKPVYGGREGPSQIGKDAKDLATRGKDLTTGSKGMSTTSSRSEKPVYGGREGASQIGKDAKDLATRGKDLTTGSKGMSTTSSRSEKPVYGGREGASQIGKDAKDLATRGKDLTTGSKGMSTTSSRSVGATRPETTGTTRTMKDVAGERVSPSKLSGSESSTGTKTLGPNASKMGAKGAGLAALLYSKEAGKDSDFKGTNKRPEVFRDTDTFTPSARTQDVRPTMIENKAPSAMQLSKIGAKTEPTLAKTATPTNTRSAPTSKYRGGRSEADINKMIAEATPERMKSAQPEIDRMVASARAEKLREDNPGMKRGGSVKAKSTCMKTGGMVKSGASRGDGCAQRGKTRGTMR
jgi:hypothetical protein